MICSHFCARRISLYMAAPILVLTAGLTSAQTTSSLRGVITDPSNAAVPSAVVTLTNTSSAATRQVVSSSTGEYSFLQMAPGNYKLRAEKPGFTVLVEDLVLQVNVPATADLQLQLGHADQAVSVSTEAPPINNSDASVGNAFTELQVRELPLQTRNVVELLSLQPGVTPDGEVMGARRDQNNITLDGVDVNDNENSGIAGAPYNGQGSNANGAEPIAGFNSVLPIPLDSVQEFRVTVAGQGADEGRSSGGQVVLVTKSGSNQFHGSAYEYNRNTLFAANSFFNNRSDVPRQTLNRNQFGASLGGRFIKDRAFFFFNYERRIDASQTAQERAVPTESLKNGDLTFLDTAGNVQTFTPAQIAQVDPLHIGLNQQILSILKQYPAGNDPAYGADSGLNFTGYRFNAPSKLDNRAYVSRMDFILDHSGHHTLSLRGTLSNSNQDQPNALEQFPGQGAASQLLNNSKGLSAAYTAVLTPSLINVFTFGITRQGLAQSGTVGTGFTLNDLDPLQNYNARASGRILPVYNYVDNLNWTKGTHTITTGINFRVMTNDRFSYANSYPSYGFSTTLAVGLGEDIQNDVTSLLQQKTGNASLGLADPDSVASAMGILLGTVDYTQITYQFLRNGSVLNQGQPTVRDFKMNEYEGFVADSIRIRPDLVVNLGLRYSNDEAPYETNGLQVDTTVPLQDYFAQRYYMASEGIPANAMPDALLTYQLNGPVNGKPSWWGAQKLNFGPRAAIAWSPQTKSGIIGKIFGGTGVIRAGAAMVYDRFGSELITQFDQFGSEGLSTTIGNPISYNFTTAPRFNGDAAVQPAAPVGGFPYTPPDVAAIVGEYQGIDSDLKSPYSYLLNASIARELPGRLTLEVGYAGRLSHRLLLQGDVYTPLENFKDPISGETWLQSMTAIRSTFNSLCAATGITTQNCDASSIATEVQNKPSLVPNNPFIQSMFPALANFYFPGSASANYFYGIYGVYNSSYLDILHAADRIPGAFNTPNGTCASRTGCYTFFALQGSSNPTWMNAGYAEYHAMTATLRRTFSNGVSFDFNYTLSHSIDNASAAEGGAGQDGAVIQDIFNQNAFRGSSDFDIRNNVNANVLYELPIGRGKPFLNGTPGWLNAIVGGWQISSILRFSSGLPTVVQGNYTWNTNYWQNSLAIMTGPVHSGVFIDSNGNPSLFSSTNTANSFADQWPGETGDRAVLRLPGMKNVDLAVAKSWKLPWEGHRIQFRAEAFNAFNLVNFISPSLALYSPSTFGEFTNTTQPRVMQFALRYEF